MEGDDAENGDLVHVDISIHSLRVEGDPAFVINKITICAFQSTPSAWRETDKKV